MTVPQFEYKLNVVSVANLVALVALLITAVSTYSTLVSNWTKLETKQAYYEQQAADLKQQNDAIRERTRLLANQDNDIRLTMVTLQSQLSARLAVLEAELKSLNVTVSKIEGAVQGGGNSARRR